MPFYLVAKAEELRYYLFEKKNQKEKKSDLPKRRNEFLDLVALKWHQKRMGLSVKEAL